MPRGHVVFARLEREALRELTDSGPGAEVVRTGGLEILIVAVGKILIPLVCAFSQNGHLDQFSKLSTSREVAAARLAMAEAEIAFPPRWQLSVIRERALVAAMAEGLSEARGQRLVDQALRTLESILAVPTRRGSL